jgi:hypothetical protein
MASRSSINTFVIITSFYSQKQDFLSQRIIHMHISHHLYLSYNRPAVMQTTSLLAYISHLGLVSEMHSKGSLNTA